jgi:hypothetical protein
MAVYVDDLGMPAKVGGLNARWSHLVADSREELHDFARRLGLRREWFQDPVVTGKPKARPGSRAAENWHYDVTESKRRQAIALGARAITWRELTGVIDARVARDAGEPAPAADLAADGPGDDGVLTLFDLDLDLGDRPAPARGEP